MDMRSKLAIIWIAIGLFEILAAHLLVARKQDPFADPNSWLSNQWIKPVKNVQVMANAAMDAGILSRDWLVGVTVRMMTQMGLGLMVLGGLLFVHSWSTAAAITISVIGIVAILAFSVAVFVLKCFRLSKQG